MTTLYYQGYIWFKFDLHRSNMNHKIDPTSGVQTHDFQIMDSTSHVPEILALMTEPSETSKILFWIQVWLRTEVLCIPSWGH